MRTSPPASTPSMCPLLVFACGRRVSLFTVFFRLLDGVAQASVRVRVTRTLTGDCTVSVPVGPRPTDVSRSFRPKCMCRVEVSTRPMPYRQSQVQASCRHSQVYVRVVRQTSERCVAVPVSTWVGVPGARRCVSVGRGGVGFFFLPPSRLPQERQCAQKAMR